MSIFGSILDKIMHFGAKPAVSHAPAAPASAPAASTTQPATTAPPPPTAAAPAPVPQAAPAPQPVDVTDVMTRLAAAKGGTYNWQSSIVDLLKLLDLDSSLAARKALADELSVHVGADGSAEENIALHKAVMAKLAANGGKVPDSLKD